ncbi:MAG: hypothetical protein O2983_04690 [Planctomycetota bacterium]|nr:hypothetical protein [Planctomycetota bacterium]MDA0918296.1 hypothetical protein [Planctomycetota bacterium]MDA1158887.1 hypothetical protein [Planctomycetota bacterium]
MANWLDKALGKSEAEPIESVPFSITCQCGVQTNGIRQERAKRVICSKCGAGHFILPVNRYPTSERTFFAADDLGVSTVQIPRSPKKPPSTQLDLPKEAHSSDNIDELFIDNDHQSTEPELDLVEAAWSTQPAERDLDDELDEEDDGDDYELADSDAEIELPPSLSRSKKKKQREFRPTSKKKPVKQPPPSTPRDKKSAKRIERPSAGDERSRQRLRLVAVGALIFVSVGAMVAFAIRGVNRERAEIAMREGRDLGEAALRKRDFVTAKLKLGEAFRAMELLGVEGKSLSETRQLWLQAEAGFGLLDDTDVVEIAMLAEEMFPEPDEDGDIDDEVWLRQFHAQYFDRWLCIQLAPVQTVTSDDEFGTRVVFPAAPKIHLVGVGEVLKKQSGGGLWFAGPLRSCRPDPMDESAWMVEFDSTRVIACDKSQPLVLPMLSEQEQAAAIAAQASQKDSPEVSDNEQAETDDE